MLFEVFSVKQTTLEIRQIRIAGKKHELGRIWMGQQHRKKGALDLALTMGHTAGWWRGRAAGARWTEVVLAVHAGEEGAVDAGGQRTA